MLKLKTPYKFTINDLFLLIWLIPGILFCYQSAQLYSANNALNTHIPFWVIMIGFIVFTVFFILFFIFEYRKPLNKNDVIKISIFGFLILSQLILLLTQSNTFTTVIIDNQNMKHIIGSETNISVKITYFFTFFYLVACYYTGFFLLPKRLKNINAIQYFIYIFYLIALAFLIVSVFIDDYISFFKALFSSEVSSDISLQRLAPKGIFGNKNLYGLFLEIGFFLAICNYTITKSKIDLIAAPLFFIHLLLTICKSGILSTAIGLFILLICSTILSVAKRKKKNIVFISIIWGIIVVFVISLFVATKVDTVFGEKINNLFYKAYSLTDRTTVWNYSFQIIKQKSVVFGVGFGLYNSIIFNVTSTLTESPVPLSHSWFLGLLGMGGVFMVATYIFISCYSFFLLYKIYKQKQWEGLSLFTLLLVLLIHSCFEDFYYIALIAIVIIFVKYETIKNATILVASKSDEK